MFQRTIEGTVFEVSHKRIESPREDVYFNHIHDYCEILLFLCGDVDYIVDGQRFHPAPYDMIFIPSATYHCLRPISSQPYENYVIGFRPDLIRDTHYEALFSGPLIINVKEEREILGFFSRLDRYDKQYDLPDFETATLALIRELMICCAYSKDSLHSAKSGAPTHIDAIVRFISENLESPLSVHEISEHMHLSVSYIQNLFSQSMHIGLKKYIMQKKIYAAHRDILNGMSPSRAGEKYGFGDYSNFYRLYKATFGSSPIKSVIRKFS